MKKKYKDNNFLEVDKSQVANLLLTNFSELMSGFYEMQSSFLTNLYGRYESIETANIVLCFAKNTHLEVIRQREKKLNHDISFNNFWNNLNSIQKPAHKIVNIVNMTGLPKETARRKIKLLMSKNFIIYDKKIKEYTWNLLDKDKKNYFIIVEKEIKQLAKFISTNANFLKIDLRHEHGNSCACNIEKEIKSQFSFYWFHFLSCQLKWLHMWQNKIKDMDLILIALQAVLRALTFTEKKQNVNEIGLENLYLLVGQTNAHYRKSSAGISASSISQVTGIPRPTCIRKLNILVNYGTLIRDESTKQYYLNHLAENRTRNILTKENVLNTVNIFSEYLSIILNAMIQNSKVKNIS